MLTYQLLRRSNNTDSDDAEHSAETTTLSNEATSYYIKVWNDGEGERGGGSEQRIKDDCLLADSKRERDNKRCCHPGTGKQSGDGLRLSPGPGGKRREAGGTTGELRHPA